MAEKIIMDKDHNIPVYSPVCSFCKHWRILEGRTCDAFPEPDSIPMDIWKGRTQHIMPYVGDNGIQFEAVPGSIAEKEGRPPK